MSLSAERPGEAEALLANAPYLSGKKPGFHDADLLE